MENENIKNLEVGMFYHLHDGSDKGHPGYLVWKDDVANLYLAIKFGSSANKDNELLIDKISDDPKYKHSYIYKRLFLGKRKDFAYSHKKDLKLPINNNHDKSLIDSVITNDHPVFSTSINRKSKRLFMFLKKKGKIKTVI